jgi:hypothetical protein
MKIQEKATGIIKNVRTSEILNSKKNGLLHRYKLLEPIIWAESLDNEGHKTGRINAFELDEWKKISKNGDKWIIVKKQEPNKYNLFPRFGFNKLFNWINIDIEMKNKTLDKLIIPIIVAIIAGLVVLIIYNLLFE